MLRTRVSKQTSKPGLATLLAPIPCDADGEIRNGYPIWRPYLPKDPGRRERLLTLLRENKDVRSY